MLLVMLGKELDGLIQFVLLIRFSLETAAQSINAVTGSQVQLTCNYRVPSNGIIIWNKNTPSVVGLSENTKITAPAELRQRLSITGNHDDGEYNLVISGVKKTDEGQYECTVYGDLNKIQLQQLVVIEGPTNVQIVNKTDINRLLGKEGQDLNIRCTANGGNPAPNMVLMIGSDSYTARNAHAIDRTITSISRSYDGANVTCQAGYDGVIFSPLTDTAVIRLDLKPLPPSFNLNPVVTVNTETLVITCTSTGSRPAPSNRLWLMGNSNVDITSSSDINLLPQPGDTYRATSTLSYRVPKQYNQQVLTCGFLNTASGNHFVQSTTIMTVWYAPVVSVQNRTFPLTQTVREVHCNIDGNPNSTFIKWQHKSKYGELIREFNQGSTLVLPEQDQDKRYQDTGEYVCITSNGIKDEDRNQNQNGSGYVVSEAPPRSLQASYQEVLGQYGRDVTLTVSVYSVPKYTTLTWLRDDNVLSTSSKYTMADVPDIITDVFYDQTVQVDVFKLTLTIKQLDKTDFTNYTLRLSNGKDEALQHLIMLISASPPETPDNFTLVSSTETSITLQWLPSFDGGHEQTFFVEYRTGAHSGWSVVEVPKIIQTARDDILTYTLTGLQDGTHYEVRMFAENKFNKSNSTESVNFSTKEKSGSGVIIGAVVGVLAGVVVVVMIIVAVVILKKRRHSDKDDTRKIKRRDSSSEREDGLKDNILYKSVDTANSLPESCEYAEVQKPNDVYAEVKKPEPQKKAKEGKKGKKRAPGKEKKKPNAVNNNSFEEYANQSDYANAEHTTDGYRNADGLQYADITFSNPPKAGKPVIHGLDERTIYSDVDHTKKAPPLPQEGAYELTDISHGK